MNIKEYIGSGILESYLLDELTPQDRLEVERMKALHPEIVDELARIELTFEAMAMKGALPPSNTVKEKVLSTITAFPARKKVVALSPPLSQFLKYATAASVAMALGASYLAYNFYSKWTTTTFALNDLIAQNQRVAQDYNSVNQKLEKIQSDFFIIENSAFKKIIMIGTANDANALASVYWNSSSQEVYLNIQHLKTIARESQFQLWAIVEGKPVDVGVFDADFSGLLKMKNVKGATAFAVTIEPRGGKDSPTLETMQVIGPVAG